MSTKPASSGFVHAMRKLYNPLGFKKGYNFSLCTLPQLETLRSPSPQADQSRVHLRGRPLRIHPCTPTVPSHRQQVPRGRQSRRVVLASPRIPQGGHRAPSSYNFSSRYTGHPTGTPFPHIYSSLQLSLRFVDTTTLVHSHHTPHLAPLPSHRRPHRPPPPPPLKYWRPNDCPSYLRRRV